MPFKATSASTPVSILGTGSGDGVYIGLDNVSLIPLNLPFADLVSWWRAEDDLTDWKGTNNGTAQGDVTFAPGKTGDAFFSLDGNGDAVLIGNPSNLQLQDFTIAAWIKRADATVASRDENTGRSGPSAVILSYGQDGYGFGLLDEGQLVLSKIEYNRTDSGPLRVTETASFHHVAVTKSGSTVKFFVDGVPTQAPDLSTTFDFHTDAVIGAGGQLSTGAYLSNSFLGSIDDVQVYSRALTDSEIAGLIQNSCVPSSPNMVSWWPWDGNANDIHGTNPATLSGRPAAQRFTPGIVGQALDFDGMTDSARVPASPTLDVGTGTGLTIAAWVKPSAISQPSPLVECNNGTSYPGLHLWTGFGEPENFFANLVDTNAANHALASTGGYLVANTWHHVALSYDRSDGVHGYANLYVDGQAVVGPADIGVFTPQTTYDLHMGLRPAGTPTADAGSRFAGAMDEVEVFSRALTTPEIQAMFNAGSAGQCKAPSVCGNGIVESAEGCDDGNAVAGDGCGATCQVEACYTCTGQPSACTSTKGLVSQWLGEYAVGGKIKDSAGVNDGTPYGGVSPVPGVFGQALSFDGVNGSVRISKSPSLNVGAGHGLTIEAWVNPSTLTQRSPLVEWNNGSAAGMHLWTGVDPAGGGAPVPGNLFANLGGGALWSAENTLTADTWQHVALTYDTSDGIHGYATLYVNGAPVRGPEDITVFTPPTSDDLYFALRPDTVPSWDAGSRFAGAMDELALYSRALSPTEIHAAYAAGVAAMAARPVSQWRAEYTAKDSVGQNDGAITGGVRFVSGRIGQAFNFDGASGAITVLDSPNLNPGQVTIEAWVRPDFARAVQDYDLDTVFTKIDSGYLGYGLFVMQGPSFGPPRGTISFEGRAQTGPSGGPLPPGYFTLRNAPPIPRDGQYHHVAATYDGAVARVYLDGVKVDEDSSYSGPIQASDVPASIGVEPYGQPGVMRYSSGAVDEVTLYDRALSREEIQAIYDAGNTGQCTSVCGNNLLEPGEQCDDGNRRDGDGCDHTCRYELIPGDGNGSTNGDARACRLEWAVVNPGNVPATDTKGRPSGVQTCTDGDTSCDFGAQSGECVFHVVACLNNADPNLPACHPIGIAEVARVLAPGGSRTGSIRTAVTNALGNLRDPVTGHPGLAPPLADTQAGLCTAQFDLRVPLHGSATRPRAGRVKLFAVTRAPASATGDPRVDLDRLTFVCTP